MMSKILTNGYLLEICFREPVSNNHLSYIISGGDSKNFEVKKCVVPCWPILIHIHSVKTTAQA